MLDSLEIQNYRNFKHLRIEKLGRVNLIIGKNNTGKSSLLEAVSVLIKKGDLDWIYNILERRREHFDEKDISTQNLIKNITNLFHGRKPIFDDVNSIKIDATVQQESKSLEFRFSKFKEVENLREISNDAPKQTKPFTNKTFTTRIEVEHNEEGTFGIMFFKDGFQTFTRFSKENLFTLSDILGDDDAKKSPLLYISTDIQNDELLFELWQTTQLTDKESDVINTLKIFNSSSEKIERIGFAEQGKKHYAICKLEENFSPVPLRSMGDGINRILTIILAMVNCKDGYFLVDEFDNGLHVSVQKQLWEIVFYLANKLNIQVFATTHSHDTIKSFQSIANSKAEYNDAILVKLVNKNGEISAKTANITELKEIVEDLIDIR